MQICAIDNGYHDTKVKTAERLFKYSSRVQITCEDHIEGTMLEYDGERYRIGIGSDDINLKKTEDRIHKVCTMAALAQVAQEETSEFKIVVGLPLMQYKNRSARESFKDYISKPAITTVRINSIKRNILIKDVLVFAQGGAALYAEPNRQIEYKNGLIAVLDWGGLTINGFVAKEMQPIPESMFTVNLGTIILYNRIRTAINSELSLNVQDYEIPYLLNTTDNDIRRVIDKVLENHFTELKKIMLKNNWSLDTLCKVGVGGGFLAAGELAKRFIPKLDIADDPVYANVKGLYNVGKMVFK